MNPISKVLSTARGLTVLVMPAVHTVFIYSTTDVQQSWLSYVLRFFAEGPGAQLFMFIMGFLIAIGRPKGYKQILSRSLLLLVAGYVLNFVRTYLPARFGMLPSEMLKHYGAGTGLHPYLPLLLTGDILHFAGISYGIVACLNKLRSSISFSGIMFITIAFAAPFLWGIHSRNALLDHIFVLLWANDTSAFFPLFPWLCYPLAGLITGNIFIRSDPDRFFRLLIVAAVSLLIIGLIILYFTPDKWEGDFYRSSPGRTLAYNGFVLLWLCMIKLWVSNTSDDNPIQRLLSFCSRNISAIYFIHWIIICWSISIVGYHQLNLANTIFAMCIISVLSFGIVFMFFQRKTPVSISKH